MNYQIRGIFFKKLNNVTYQATTARTCEGENTIGEESVEGIVGGAPGGCFNFISLRVAWLCSARPRETVETELKSVTEEKLELLELIK